MSSEEDDLRSALYLEQAAYCLLHDKKPRKYAMHMVLAAHRFTKARQQRHALRCARQALQIYDGRGWTLAEDHIYWSIGLLTGQLYKQRHGDVSLLPEGLRSLSQLLISCCRQEAAQQANYLLEFLKMYQAWQMVEKQDSLVKLPLPIVEENSVSVRITQSNLGLIERHVGDTQEEAARWGRMEELALTATPKGVPVIFRPSLPVLTKNLPNPHGLVAAVNGAIAHCFSYFTVFFSTSRDDSSAGSFKESFAYFAAFDSNCTALDMDWSGRTVRSICGRRTSRKEWTTVLVTHTA